MSHDFGKNFVGSLFSGTAVVEAVRLEEYGNAALLFCSKECAQFYSSKFNERIFTLDKNLILSWTTDERSLITLAAICSRHLSKILSYKDSKYDSIIMKLKNTILYSINSAKYPDLPFSIILAVVGSPDIKEKIRNEIYEFLGVGDISYYKELIDYWRNIKDFELIKTIADLDTSIP